MRHVRFRHELARNAIRSSIPIAARRRLHGEILAALLAEDADPADVVHHAEAAGAEDVVAEYALVAARRAAALGSNRESYSHYRRASQFFDRLSAVERARVLEELASVAYAVGRLDGAFVGIERAIDVYRALGDEESVGRCLRALVALPLGRGGRLRRAHDRARGDRDPRGARPVGRARTRVRRPIATDHAGRRHGDRTRVGRASAGAGDAARRRPYARVRAREHRHCEDQSRRQRGRSAPGRARRRGRRR